MMQIGAMALAAGLAASGQAPGSQWWNPKDKATFERRQWFDGVAPTGFLDQYGQISLMEISSSPILATAIQMGGWTKIHAPNKTASRKVFSYLQTKRGSEGWDLVCEALRIQVLAETKLGLDKILTGEVWDQKTGSSPERCFGAVCLDWLNKRRPANGSFYSLSGHETWLVQWKNWTPKDRRASAAHTLLYFSHMRFGAPVIPVMEAARIIGGQDVSDYVFLTMSNDSWSAACWPSQHMFDRDLPKAVRPLPPADLAREAVARIRTHPRDWVAAYAAHLMFLLMERYDDSVRYGKLYLQMADKTSVHLAEVQKTIDSINSKKKAKAKEGSG